MKFASYDIVFQEVPDEVSLALNITGCPLRCKGCHSPHLWEDIGEVLDEQAIDSLIATYSGDITCVALMGGDADPKTVERLIRFVKLRGLKTAWYSGRQALPDGFEVRLLDYLKLGPYVEALGGLKSKTTNQRLYRVESDGSLKDITYRLQPSR
jgi:anaerobic ribonucleoside-triphosphate reductase activating protein